MIRPFPIPVPLVGFAAAGIALGVGWQLGSYLGAVVLGERTIDWSPLKRAFQEKKQEEHLWRREFGKISQD